MKKLYFNNYEDFSYNIADKYEFIKYDEYNDVAIIAKYEEARRIIKKLLFIGYDLHNVEMHNDEWDGYDSEYIVSLCDNEIWCEPMKRENGYITDDSPVIYVLDNCSSKVIPYCKGKNVFEVSIGDDFDDEYDCGGCDIDECIGCKEYDNSKKCVEYSKDSGGNMHGFTASKSNGNLYYSYSVYTSDTLSVKDIQSLLQEAGF